jgi:hypothetical protein
MSFEFRFCGLLYLWRHGKSQNKFFDDVSLVANISNNDIPIFKTSNVMYNSFVFYSKIIHKRFFIVQINEDSHLIQEPNELDDMDSLDHHIPNSLEVKTKNKKQEVVIERRTNLPKNVPQFLLKFSASYFQVADFKKEIVFGIFKHKLKSKNSQKISLKNQNKTPTKQAEIGGFLNFELMELQNKSSAFNKTNERIIGKKSKINENTESNSVSLSQIIKTESDKSIKTCVICFDRPPDAVLMECGHGGKLIKRT